MYGENYYQKYDGKERTIMMHLVEKLYNIISPSFLNSWGFLFLEKSKTPKILKFRWLRILSEMSAENPHRTALHNKHTLFDKKRPQISDCQQNQTLPVC